MALSDLFHAVVRELTVSQDRKNELHAQVDEHFQAASEVAGAENGGSGEPAPGDTAALHETASAPTASEAVPGAAQPGLIYQKDA